MSHPVRRIVVTFWCIGLLAVVLLGTPVRAQDQSVPAVEPNEPRGGFIPTWKVGDSWILEATYRDLRSPGEVWLPPIRWMFKVRALKNYQRQKCYVIHVFPRNRHLKVQAILYLSTIDVRPLRVIDIFPTKEGVKYQERVIDPFHPQPLFAEASLVPYDLPLFPLVRPSIQQADGFGAYREAKRSRKIDKITTVGGLRFKKSLHQEEKKPSRQYADVFGAYRLAGETFQVELGDEQGKETLVQIWQEGAPWALSSESPSRKVRLLPPTAAPVPAPAPITPQEGN